MRRVNPVSLKVKAPSRGFVSRFPGETADLLATGTDKFSLPGMANRTSTVSSNVRYDDGVARNAPGYDRVALVVSILEDLVAHWRLDEVTDTRFDSTLNHHDLTEVPGNFVGFEHVQQTDGKYANALRFPSTEITAPTMVFVPEDTTGTVAGLQGFAEVGGIQYLIGAANLYKSTDGLTWTVHNVHGIAGPSDLLFAEGLFIVPGTGPNRIYSSPDGLTWTAHTIGASLNMVSVAYGNGVFVAVGGTSSATSPDGLTWTDHTIAGWVGMNSVTFGLGLFIAVGQNSQIYSSVDGITWTVQNSGSSNFHSVAFSDNLFVACGVLGLLFTSPDGLTWTSRGPVGGAVSLTGAGGGNGVHTAANDDGQVYTSPDGVLWTLARTELLGRSVAQHATFYSPTLNILFVGFNS